MPIFSDSTRPLRPSTAKRSRPLPNPYAQWYQAGSVRKARPFSAPPKAVDELTEPLTSTGEEEVPETPVVDTPLSVAETSGSEVPPQDTTETEDLPAIASFSESDQAKILKIQAVARGNASRKQAKEAAAAAAAAVPEQTKPEQSLDQPQEQEQHQEETSQPILADNTSEQSGGAAPSPAASPESTQEAALDQTTEAEVNDAGQAAQVDGQGEEQPQQQQQEQEQETNQGQDGKQEQVQSEAEEQSKADSTPQEPAEPAEEEEIA